MIHLYIVSLVWILIIRIFRYLDVTSGRIFGFITLTSSNFILYIVFLDYINLYKGYKCLDISSGRVYISRDVIFDESQFPFDSIMTITTHCLLSHSE
jgi:hypothetical protein